MIRLRFTTARQVFEAYPPALEDIEAEPSDAEPVGFLKGLLDGKTPEDAIGFCAKFPQPPNTVFAHFGTDGAFQEEEIKDPNGKEVDGDNKEQENQNEDNTCECQ